jgi:hypothetical protein
MSSLRMKVLYALAALGLIAVSAVAPAVASAQPSSMSEAEATGDPAASAPVLATPEVFMYQGKQISEATFQKLGLACLQTGSEFLCKNSPSEFAGTDSPAPAGAQPTAPPPCGVVELWLYKDKQYEGPSVGYYNYYSWANVPTSMNNATSSYRTGTASAHLADFAEGGGYWFPGPTGYCEYMSNIAQGYPEWNDRISSMYRY